MQTISYFVALHNEVKHVGASPIVYWQTLSLLCFVIFRDWAYFLAFILFLMENRVSKPT